MFVDEFNDVSELTSKIHCELLVDFVTNTIEELPSYQSSQHTSIQNLLKSHYVCQWWIQQFKDIEQNCNADSSVQFKKKHRDHIRLKEGDNVPFRRSGLWMAMKTVIEIILTKQFREAGVLIYKLLITRFLTYMLEKYAEQRTASMDLLVYCIRKIFRRLNKIETRLVLTQVGDENVGKWIRYNKQVIEMKIDEIFPKSFRQDIVQSMNSVDQLSSVNGTEFNSPTIYQHECVRLKQFLHDNSSNELVSVPSSDDEDDVNHLFDTNHPDDIQFYSDLMNRMGYTIGTALTRVEIWVATHLKEWLDQQALLTSGMNRFEHLREFFEDYQNGALGHYWPERGSTDPIGYSRFILTALTIIQCMHKKLCDDPRFKRLKEHIISIPHLLKLFRFLILPVREDMIRARHLYDYFREFSTKKCPDLLSQINSTDAFGVAYAACCDSMVQNLAKIRERAESDRQAKIIEVNEAKSRYGSLMKSIRKLSCSCRHSLSHMQILCKKCSTQDQADNIKVDVFECPIPEAEVDAQAVLFELQMPIEIRSYRDVLWQFINRR